LDFIATAPSRFVLEFRYGAISSGMALSVQAARSIGCAMVVVASVCQLSTLRMLLWPEASSAPEQKVIGRMAGADARLEKRG
jgi:hypothetical protein